MRISSLEKENDKEDEDEVIGEQVDETSDLVGSEKHDEIDRHSTMVEKKKMFLL